MMWWTLNPVAFEPWSITASWEKGLTYVAEGSITPDEYMVKLDHFITSRTVGVQRAQQSVSDESLL